MSRLLPWFAALTLLLSGCGGEDQSPSAPPPDPTPAPSAMRFGVAPLAMELVSAVLPSLGRPSGAEAPSVAPMEEGPAIAALLRGELDAVFVLRGPSPQEQIEARGEGLVPRDPLVTTALASEALALIGSVDGRSASLTRTEAEAIVRGGPWPDGAASTLYSLPARSPTGEAIVSQLLRGEALRSDLVEVGDEKEVVRRVKGDPSALGIVSARNLLAVRVLALKTERGLLTPGDPDWPLRREIVALTHSAPELASALAAAAQRSSERIEQLGFVPAATP